MLFLFCLTIFCVLSILLLIFRTLKQDDFQKIPGPKGLPLLGNSLDFFIGSEETFKYFRIKAHEYKELFKLHVGATKAVVIYTPEYVEKLISGTTYNRKGYVYTFLRPWLKDGLLVSYGSKWQQRRKILTPAFHFKVLRQFSTILVKKSESLVKKLESEVGKEQSDILSFISDFTLKSICETAMGTSLDDNDETTQQYRNAVHQLGAYLSKRATNFWYHIDLIFKCSNLARKQNKALSLTSAFRNRILKSRRENPCNVYVDDTKEENSDVVISGKKLAMLDILLKAEDEGAIDENGISEEMDTFIFEGHDTSAAALQYTFMLLANHQDSQDKIVEELDRIYGSTDRAAKMSDLTDMKYLECCIKESLRLYPPVFFLTREAENSFELKNNISVSNVQMAVWIYDMHRREDQFVEPLKFKPERFILEPTWHRYAYIPFSAGPRNCIGQKFAMMELKFAISSVLRKFKLLPVTKPEDMVFLGEQILRTKDPVYVKFERRHRNEI